MKGRALVVATSRFVAVRGARPASVIARASEAGMLTASVVTGRAEERQVDPVLVPREARSAGDSGNGGSSGFDDQVRDLLRVGNYREVAGVDLDRCRVHAVGKEALEFR